MSALSAAYEEFLLSTDDAYLNVNARVKDAVSLRNHCIRRVMEGKDPAHVIQNGKTIRNFIQLEQTNTTHYYGSGTKENPTNPQVVKRHETAWAKFRNDITWDEEEFDFHEGDSAQMFFDLRMMQEQKCWQDKVRFMEVQGLWATPDGSTMEATSPAPAERHITSFPVLVNEENFGTANATMCVVTGPGQCP